MLPFSGGNQFLGNAESAKLSTELRNSGGVAPRICSRGSGGRMTPPSSQRMSEACLLLLQQGTLNHQGPDMAPSRGGKASEIPASRSSTLAASAARTTASPPRTTGVRRPLSPVGESQPVAVSDQRENLPSNQQPASPIHPVSAETSAGSSAIAPPHANNELSSSMETEDEKDGDETTYVNIQEGSASSPVKSDEAATVPQHETFGSSTPEEELKSAAIIQRNKSILLQGLSLTHVGGSLTLINLSRRGLVANDAKLIKRAMEGNPHLSVLKLSYNDLKDQGAAIIASGFVDGNGGHHKNLSVLDLGFNGIGDNGCAALSLHAVARNEALRVLYLSGNNIGEQGTLSLSGALLQGCRLRSLHISANRIGSMGIQALARAVAETEACRNSQTGETKVSLEELYLGEISMKANVFVPVPSMLLTNLSLRVLCLSNTGIDDQSMALLAQALSRNKNVPLESIQLSFNEITCAGVECFMNAVWASPTLRELKLDNNNIRDRGAQLAAVALTAIDFRLLDLGFNKVTNVGIKALMKSLSETKSLETLSLSGIPLDATACKAVSYALAYNTSLRALNVDHCEVGYSGQRHIVAGIVSNRWSLLRVITGFDIGAIAVTLQLPQIIEAWSNDKVLRFVHFMWTEWNKTQPPRNATKSEGIDSDDQNGPAAPATVVRAAKQGLTLMGSNLDSSLHTEPYEREITETSPVVPANATMLERTLSGTIRVPPLVESHRHLVEEASIPSADAPTGSSSVRAKAVGIMLDPMRKNRNLEWLRTHFRSLNEVSHLPFNSADMWQLHQYFFSPPHSSLGTPSSSPDTSDYPLTSDAFSAAEEGPDDVSVASLTNHKRSRTPVNSPMPTNPNKKASLGRDISYQHLDEAAFSEPISTVTDSLHKRSSHPDVDEERTHASKRARNFKPRIAYYPRIREKLEALGTKPSQEQTLALLRLLKFVESVMFQGRNPFSSASNSIYDPEQPSVDDVEMIILDLL